MKRQKERAEEFFPLAGSPEKKNEKESLSLPILREYNISTKGEVIHAVINQNATGYGRRRVCRLCCVFLRRIFSSRKDAT